MHSKFPCYRSVIAFGTALAALGLVTAKAQAPQHNLVITENSSASLVVSYDGSSVTVTPLASDHWQFTLPESVHLGFGEGSFGAPDGAAVTEPGGGVLGPWNNVFTSTTDNTPFVPLVDVRSDSSTSNAFATPVNDGVRTEVGLNSSRDPVFLTFHDLGDEVTHTAPDATSTASLLALGSLAILGAARRKS